MTSLMIDGKEFARQMRSLIADEVSLALREYDICPTLDVIIVGDDAASHVYVNNKEKAAAETGIGSHIHRLPEDISQAALLELITSLNAKSGVHGILVQMPLPKHLSGEAALEKIDAYKDVDGFHIVNTGTLHGASARRSLRPCTPSGCMMLLETVISDISGLHALVIGRSHIVGRPVAEMLLQKNATVTIAHSRTRGLPELVRQADILVAAVGIAEYVQGDWIKKGAIILDVGINRVERDGKRKLVGDVDFSAALERARAITPVPGGIGPMTIACLLQNTVYAAYLQHDLPEAYAAFEGKIKDLSHSFNPSHE
ncbi:MAG: bifunctional methylenetetrahydrofolate dehydrogenase/methenyltetrahydrofolate cyclohydrolase FolD [Pseudomonadota bacterium]